MAESGKFEHLEDVEGVLRILNKISIFAGLSKAQLGWLFGLLDKVTYRKGEVIFRQGGEPSHIYVVESGRVKLVVEEDGTFLELIVFEEGACFGESSIIGIQRHAATGVAVEDVELIVLSRKALMSIYESNLELFAIIVLNIAREVCRRLHSSEEVLLHYVRRK